MVFYSTTASADHGHHSCQVMTQGPASGSRGSAKGMGTHSAFPVRHNTFIPQEIMAIVEQTSEGAFVAIAVSFFQKKKLALHVAFWEDMSEAALIQFWIVRRHLPFRNDWRLANSFCLIGTHERQSRI